MKATIARDEIAVTPSYRDDLGIHWLTVDCPAGWDDVKKICKKVLHFSERRYTFRGWNSDRNEAFFAESQNIATIK